MGILSKLFGANINSLKRNSDVNGLIKALNHKEWEIRSEAAIALGELRDQRGVDPLIAALQDQKSVVRNSAIGALGMIGDLRALSSLEDALQDADRGNRPTARMAIKLLERQQTPES